MAFPVALVQVTMAALGGHNVIQTQPGTPALSVARQGRGEGITGCGLRARCESMNSYQVTSLKSQDPIRIRISPRLRLCLASPRFTCSQPNSSHRIPRPTDSRLHIPTTHHPSPPSLPPSLPPSVSTHQ